MTLHIIRQVTKKNLKHVQYLEIKGNTFLRFLLWKRSNEKPEVESPS